MHHQLASLQPITQRVAYEAVSYPEYRIDVAPNGTVSRSLQSVTPRHEIRAPAVSHARCVRTPAAMTTFIMDVLKMFNEQEYYYTLEPPPFGRDPVDRFLFDSRQGFLRTLRLGVRTDDARRRDPVAHCARLPGRRGEPAE